MTTTAEALERIAVALETLADRRPVLMPSGIMSRNEMLNKAADLAVEAEADAEGNALVIASAQVKATLALAWAKMASNG